MFRRILLILFCCLPIFLEAQTEIDFIVEDIFSMAIEEGRDVDFAEVQSNLRELANHPININQTSSEELKRMYFLTDKQIEDILFYVYEHPIDDIKELLLISGLKDYEVRNMKPFVVIGEPKKEILSAKEILQKSNHEVDLRADARSVEKNATDPFYVNLRYKWTAANRFFAGFSVERDVAEPWFYPRKTYGFDHYGGFFQMNNVSHHVQTIVLGDFRAAFGQGLVVNSGRMMTGKSNLLTRKGVLQEGLKKYSGTNEYNFFRGVGATIEWNTKNTDQLISVFYSIKKVDGNVQNGAFPSIVQTGYHRSETELNYKREVWQQVAGMNYTLSINQFRVGMTLLENLLGDTLKPKLTYYNENYFRGIRQFSAGLNFNYSFWRCTLFGEMAVSQNSKWGWADVTGLSCRIASKTHLTLLYRYFSPHFDNMYTSTFSESSRANDENGLFLGAEIRQLNNWIFSCYADGWYFSDPKYQIFQPSAGWDFWGMAKYMPDTNTDMMWRFRAKHKGENDKYALQYHLNWISGSWALKTRFEVNITPQKTYGIMAMQEMAYHFAKIPMVLQLSVMAFDAQNYDNRIYVYESDVLYAFSIPMAYGLGGKWNFNVHYSPAEWITLYLKVGETIYAKSWQNKQQMAFGTATDIHFLARLQIK